MECHDKKCWCHKLKTKWEVEHRSNNDVPLVTQLQLMAAKIDALETKFDELMKDKKK